MTYNYQSEASINCRHALPPKCSPCLFRTAYLPQCWYFCVNDAMRPFIQTAFIVMAGWKT